MKRALALFWYNFYMENKLKINKYLYKCLMKIECGHFLKAFDKNLLDISEEDNFDNESFSLSPYLDMLEAFENSDSEVPDAIKFFLKLKTKVLNYYKEIYKNELKGFHENFELQTKDAFLSFDLFKIDKEKKDIQFVIIKPSTFESTSKHFLKTWNKKRNTGTVEALNFIEVSKKKDIELFVKESWLPFDDKISRNNSFPKDAKILLIPELWSSTKRQQAFELLFLMRNLHDKYPGYKITAKLPLINKTLKPYTFTTLEYILDVEDKIIKAAYDSIFKWSDKKIDKFIAKGKETAFHLPKYQKKFPTNKKCFICNKDKSEDKISQEYRIDLVEEIIAEYPDKIAMFDFETINDPLPNTNFYYPYDKIVVQISMHLLEKGKIVGHKEYIAKDLSKKELQKIYYIIVEAVNQGYKLCAYYKAFEGSAIKTIERVLSQDKISKYYNLSTEDRNSDIDREKYEILDLMDFFNKKNNYPPISLWRFGQSSSIKKTIEFYTSNENPYNKLTINNGFKAMNELYKILVEKNYINSDQTHEQLYKYCKQDTLTMVNIYNKIREVRKLIQENVGEKEKIINELDKK